LFAEFWVLGSGLEAGKLSLLFVEKKRKRFAMMGHVVPSCCSSFELQFSRVEDKKVASGLAMGLFVRRRRSCVLQMQGMWVQERKLERRRILCHVRALKDQQQLEGSEAVQEGKQKSGKSSKLLGSSQAEDGSRGNNKHGLSRRALVALIALSAQGFAVSPSTRLVSAKLINGGCSSHSSPFVFSSPWQEQKPTLEFCSNFCFDGWFS
jgi:hypothetical protein